MLKRILVLLLQFSFCYFAQAQSQNPVFLLEQECLHFPTININNIDSQIGSQNVSKVANNLERQLLGIYNINDRIKYFHQQQQVRSERNALLRCQLHLADIFSQLINSSKFNQLLQLLKQSNNNQYTQLAKYLFHIQQQELDSKQKSQLATAQASFQQSLGDTSLTLNIIKPQCQMPVFAARSDANLAKSNYINTNNLNTDNAKINSIGTNVSNKHKPLVSKNINMNVAWYLINQTNAGCRQDVWLAYQNRANIKNHTALNRILAIRSQQAKHAGYQDYASMQLANTYLKSTQTVIQFLQQQLKPKIATPWNIGRDLSLQSKKNFKSITGKLLLKDLLASLQPLAIRVEKPQANIIRLWHRNFFLGDIYINEVNSPAQSHAFPYSPLIKPVIGRQFGLSFLSLPSTVTSQSQQQKLIQAFAQAISDLSAGSHFYFNNQTENKMIGVYWLTQFIWQQFIKHDINNATATSERFQLINDYKKQIKIIRALMIIQVYSADFNAIAINGTNKLQQTIFKQWQVNKWSPYGFNAMVTFGPLYFESIWQQTLADYIFKQTYQCQTAEYIYNTLIVNEGNLPLQQILTKLIWQSVSPKSLIRKFKHAALHHSVGDCPITTKSIL